MSFVVGDEIITDMIPTEVDEILDRMKLRTKEKSSDLMDTIASSGRFMAYVIPGGGMVLFADELADNRKIFRFLISKNGELYIDNKQRRGEMFCPLFEPMENEINKMVQKEADIVVDDKEYRIYDTFMPKIVETINHILTDKPEIFN